jgi:hypothetical protein
MSCLRSLASRPDLLGDAQIPMHATMPHDERGCRRAIGELADLSRGSSATRPQWLRRLHVDPAGLSRFRSLRSRHGPEWERGARVQGGHGSYRRWTPDGADRGDPCSWHEHHRCSPSSWCRARRPRSTRCRARRLNAKRRGAMGAHRRRTGRENCGSSVIAGGGSDTRGGGSDTTDGRIGGRRGCLRDRPPTSVRTNSQPPVARIVSVRLPASAPPPLHNGNRCHAEGPPPNAALPGIPGAFPSTRASESRTWKPCPRGWIRRPAASLPGVPSAHWPVTASSSSSSRARLHRQP